MSVGVLSPSKSLCFSKTFEASKLYMISFCQHCFLRRPVPVSSALDLRDMLMADPPCLSTQSVKCTSSWESDKPAWISSLSGLKIASSFHLVFLNFSVASSETLSAQCSLPSPSESLPPYLLSAWYQSSDQPYPTSSSYCYRSGSQGCAYLGHVFDFADIQEGLTHFRV